MTHAPFKGAIAAVLALGLVASTTGAARPAGTPPVTQDPRKAVKPVVLVNQTALVAQGLKPTVALTKASRVVKFHLTTAYYIPVGYRLAIVRVFPYIPYSMEPGDTQTFMKLVDARKPASPRVKPAPVPSFEIDHQFGQPFVYPGVAYFKLSTARLGPRTVSLAEQKYTDVRRHRTVDLLWVYWFDAKSRIATEVTADLQSSRLPRSEVLKVAASVR